MRRTLFACSIVAAFTLFAAHGFASQVTLSQETQTCTSTDTSGCIAITKTSATTFTVTFPSSFSGTTNAPGTYSFNSVGTLTFSGGDASNGSPYFTGGPGTISLDGSTYDITWTLLDGDGSGYTLSFTTPLSTQPDEIFLNSPVSGPANFSALFSSSIGTTVYASISAGQVVVPEPASMLLLGTGLLGLGFLRRRKLGVKA